MPCEHDRCASNVHHNELHVKAPIIIFSKTVEEHLCKLREVFRHLREVGLKVKPSKCHLLLKSVKYLGHVVSAQGAETDAKKTQAVTT